MERSTLKTSWHVNVKHGLLTTLPAFTIWMTGLSGAGKSTLASGIKRHFEHGGRACCILDGDALRSGLSGDLGFSRQDRSEQARRVAHVAKLMNDAGLIVVVALVSPYRADRESAREIIGSGAMFEVWVDTPLDVCRTRDPKGLYRQVQAGRLPGMTGISDPYEPPEDGALRIDTTGRDVPECVMHIIDAIGVGICSD